MSTDHQAYIVNEPTSWRNRERHQAGCNCGTMLGWITKGARKTNPYTLTKDAATILEGEQFVGHYQTAADALGRAWAEHVGPLADHHTTAASTPAQHTLKRDEKQLGNRAAGTVVQLHCPDCGGQLVGQLIYIARSTEGRRCVELNLRGHEDHWFNVEDDGPNQFRLFTPLDAIAYAQLFHENYLIDPLNANAWTHHGTHVPVHSSSVINDEPATAAEPEQPALDDEALIAQAILTCANQIITAIDTAADQAFPHRRGRRDLAQVRILNAVGAMLQQLARDRGVQIARSQRASQADVARALGVTRARVNQMLKDAG